jgi:hypothetical protein
MLKHSTFISSRRRHPRGFAAQILNIIKNGADLGWAPGENITSALSTALGNGTLSAGDYLLLPEMYEIDSGAALNLPDDFTVAGDAAGSGLTVVNVLADGNHALAFGANNTFRDMTVLHTGTEPEGTKTNSTSFEGNHDLSIINSYFEGNVGTFVDDFGDRLVVRNSHFYGGYWAITANASDTAEIRNTLFENSLGDGIKTTKGDKTSSNFLVTGSVFLNNSRDGIDTTGGFRDSVVEDSYFVNNFLGLDLKSHYAEAAHLGKVQNINILIRGSEFVNNNNAMAITTLDQTVDNNWQDYKDSNLFDNENWGEYSPHDIFVENSLFEYDGPNNGSNVFNLKGSSGVSYTSIEVLGNFDIFYDAEGWRYGNIDPDIYNSNYSGTNLITGDPRSPQPESYYRSLAGTDFS